MKAFLFAVLCAVVGLHAETYSIGPDSKPHEGVPKGQVIRRRLEPGRFYPGTPHNYAVYIPAQYKSDTPAPFMVFLDGSGALNGLHIPIVFDNLISKGQLPPLIGIFVDPGVLPSVSADAQNRYERIFEYDSTSDRFSRFLLEELIPEVAKSYNLSRNPDDHAISGTSTGAVGAFVAAWQRPDQFHRVLSLIGTFVDMKGAEELPSLIRKTEPKPIRILLQDGRNDHLVAGQPWGINFGGSWPINNQVMFDAFEFAGYDAKLVWGDGAHDTKQGSAMMPEAVRWLWADYPKPIGVHEPASMEMAGYEPRGRVYSIVSAAHPWERIGGTYGKVAGLAADSQGNLLFADALSGSIYKAGPDGAVEKLRDDLPGVTDLKASADGSIYAAIEGQGTIVSLAPDGSKKTIVQGVKASGFVFTHTGDLYTFDSEGRGIVHIDSDGKATPACPSPDIGRIAGLGLSADQSMVYVSDGLRRYGWSFQIAADGSLRNGEPFYRLYVPELTPNSGAGEASADSIGQVYFATALGIQVTEQNGRVAAILNPPEGVGPVTGIAFAGADLSWLYASQGGHLYRRGVKIPGTASWKLVKPPKPPL